MMSTPKLPHTTSAWISQTCDPFQRITHSALETGRQKWIRFSGYFGIIPLEAFPPWRLARFC